MTAPLDTVHHVAYIVDDMERSLPFYTKLLGREPAMTTRIPGKDSATLIALYDLGGIGLELVAYQPPRAASAPDGKHVCFQVADADAAYREMVAAGHEFAVPPRHLGPEAGAMEGCVFAFFRDPDGNLIEIMQDPTKR